MAEISGFNALVNTLKLLANGNIQTRGGRTQKLTEGGKDRVAVLVGYFGNAYAIHVHENIEMKWRGKPRAGVTSGGTGKLKTKAQKKWFWGAVSRGEIPDPRPPGKGVYWGPAGEAKFLEKPTRRMAKDGTIGRIVTAVIKAGGTLEEGLTMAGLELQAVSQMLVPVDQNVLKSSADTRVEKG